MDKSTKLVRLQQWSEEIAACNQSGMKKGEWCRENGINLKTFYYHQRICRLSDFFPFRGEVFHRRFSSFEV